MLGLFNDHSSKYTGLKFLGEGSFGVVYRAINKETNEVVAIKKIRMQKPEEGVNFTALREIKILNELQHENIVKLHDVFLHNGQINLVYEFMETDLSEIIQDKNVILTAADIKAYMRMLLQGVAECHRNWILHRDLKPGNLLVSSKGDLKIGDFGLAKLFGSPDRRYTTQCVTRFYRAPELLYGSTYYGTGVDMWAVGCIFAEMMLRTPYFPGENDLDQLAKIFAALGTPTEEQWPEMRSLPNFIEFESFTGTPFNVLFSAASQDALDLLSKMLVYDPNKRISAADALKHPYFVNEPKETPKHLLPLPTKLGKTKPDIGSPEPHNHVMEESTPATLVDNLKLSSETQSAKRRRSLSNVGSPETRQVRRKLDLYS